MSNIKVKSIIKNIDENVEQFVNTNGKFIDNKIIYKDNDIDVTILINHNTIEIERSSTEYKINMYFNSDKAYMTVLLKENNLVFSSDIELKSLNIYNNKIEIDYNLECEYLFTLEYNVEE